MMKWKFFGKEVNLFSFLIMAAVIFVMTTPVFATVHEVIESDDWLAPISSLVADGDTIMFVTDGGSYMTPNSGYFPSKNLVMMAAPGLVNKPVLSTNDPGYIGKVNGNLKISGLAFNGLHDENGDGGTYRILYLNKNIEKLVVEDCDFYNIRGRAITSKSTITDTIIVNNCSFWDINGSPLYFKDNPGLIKYVKVTNSSFWNANSHALYFSGAEDTVEVSSCSFLSIAGRGVYPLSCTNGLVIRDNIFMMCGTSGVKAYGTDPIVEYNCFWNDTTETYIESDDTTLTFPTGNIFANPWYEDTYGDDISLALALTSPCIGTASDGGDMGDTRWGTYDADAVTLWEIQANNNWINNIKDVLTEGDTVVFVTDGGSYMTPASGYIPSQELVLMAAPGLTNKPVLSTNDGGYVGKVNDNLTVIGLAFDGLYAENGDNSTYRMLYQNKPVDFVVLEDCDFYNMRGNAIVSKEPIIDNLVVNNCVFHDANNPPIYFKETSGLVNTATITNCSFWNLNNHAIYIVEGGGPLTVTNCTFYNVGQRGIYPKDHVNGTVIRDNIFMSCGVAGVKVYGSDPEVEFNCFWDNALDIDDADATNVSTVGNIYANPGFEDTSVDNFSLALNVMTSPCIGTASDGGNMGDPRWGITDPSAVTRWEVEAGTDWFVPIKEHLTAGDTISLTTDGGVYYSSVKFSFPAIPLVLMAKPGLSEKPVLKAAFNESRYKIYGPITIKGVRIEGDGIVENGIPYGIYFNDEADDFGTVVIEDCEFVGYRLRPIHMNDNNYTDTLIVNNCLFKEIGETGIYGKHDARNVGVARITNCTFYKVGQNNIRLNNVGDLEVSHCTFFYNDPTVSGRTSNIGIHAENDTMVVIRDNIFVNQAAEGVRVYGPSPTVEYNMFWECAENIVSEDDTTLTFPIFNFEDDPMFKDTSSATLDLAIVESCLGVGTASDGTNLGDPRWGTWSGSGGIAGDCNGDGVVDVLDVLGVVNHILGTAPLEGEGLVLADCNMDGEIDVLDALGIVNVILGTGTCPPAGAKAAFNSETLEFLKSLKTYLSPEDFAAFMALVKSAMNLPIEYSLAQNYPNPFNPVTTIDYALAKESPVKLVVYNVLGQKVKTLVNEKQPIGYHVVRWDGRGEDGSEVSSGVYFYRLNAGSFTKTMKMMLLK
ncbi:MAG: right-handed parallel beta-helix repeat-containing protein [Gemmatimonadota bacterium]|nr:MAG: right-handed parallel beta-helix repeat-containing protein [Gemmatimonadota bacterium]